jgi:hypothetical protein
MYSIYHNAKLASWNKTVNFAKSGNLNLSRVFFITTSSSASASELLINNLKPYMDVKIIGIDPVITGNANPTGLVPGVNMPFTNLLVKFNKHMYGSSGVAGPTAGA